MLVAGYWMLDSGSLKVGFVFPFSLFVEAEVSSFTWPTADGTEDGSGFAALMVSGF
jgi:hypothetical protein